MKAQQFPLDDFAKALAVRFPDMLRRPMNHSKRLGLANRPAPLRRFLCSTRNIKGSIRKYGILCARILALRTSCCAYTAGRAFRVEPCLGRMWRDGRSRQRPLRHILAVRRGRPPLRPFSLAAEVLAAERDLPPAAPICAAIQLLDPRTPRRRAGT